MPASRPRERLQPVVLALGVVGLALLVLPLLGLILRAPWGDLAELFVRQEVLLVRANLLMLLKILY